MTPDLIAKLEELLGKATPGPWLVEADSRPDIFTKSNKGGYFDEGHLFHMDNYDGNYQDAELICLLRNNIQGILDERKRLREALELAKKKQPEALEVCRKEGFVFDGKGGSWEKLAFTFYTDLCEVSQHSEAALSAAEES